MVNREFAVLMIFVDYLYIHDKNSELIYDAKFAYEVKNSHSTNYKFLYL
ncbi:hypothetical protein QF024_002573 [Chryseobacterium nepalense]|nr:hypothetical protein [Chryseobacterium nepalense]